MGHLNSGIVQFRLWHPVPATSLTGWSSRRQQLRCWCPPLRSGAAYRER